jgi:hypothetical protein
LIQGWLNLNTEHTETEGKLFKSFIHFNWFVYPIITELEEV